MKLNKKILGVAVLLIIVAAVFYFRDSRDMKKIEKEQLQSAEKSADSILNVLDTDLDFDESEIEDASLAYDTINNH